MSPRPTKRTWGLDRFEGDGPVEPVLQPAVEIVADARLDGDVDAAKELLGRIHPDDVAVDLEGQRAVADVDEPLELLVPGQDVGEAHEDMPRLAQDGLDGDGDEVPQGGDVDVAPPPVIDADRSAVPRQGDGRGRLLAGDVLDGKRVRQPVLGVAPFDRERPAVLDGFEDLFDQGLLLRIGRDDAAPQDLDLRPVRILGEEPVERDLHVGADGPEAEFEPGVGLGQVEDLPHVENGPIVLARLQLALGRKDELARVRPFGRPVDRGREFEEPGCRFSRARIIDEEDAHRGLARHRSRGEGADIAVPFELGLGRGRGRGRLFRFAAGKPEGADGNEDQAQGLLGHGGPSRWTLRPA